MNDKCIDDEMNFTLPLSSVNCKFPRVLTTGWVSSVSSTSGLVTGLLVPLSSHSFTVWHNLWQMEKYKEMIKLFQLIILRGSIYVIGTGTQDCIIRTESQQRFHWAKEPMALSRISPSHTAQSYPPIWRCISAMLNLLQHHTYLYKFVINCKHYSIDFSTSDIP